LRAQRWRFHASFYWVFYDDIHGSRLTAENIREI